MGGGYIWVFIVYMFKYLKYFTTLKVKTFKLFYKLKITLTKRFKNKKSRQGNYV